MTNNRRGILVVAIMTTGFAVLWVFPRWIETVKAQERTPGFLADDGKTHDPGACGWNGDLDEPTGRCTVRIVFPQAYYGPVTCVVKKQLP